MSIVRRVLDAEPVTSLADYEAAGGRAGLDAALASDRATIIATIAAAGLRGRGGAGFPTAVKWQSITDNLSDELAAAVVVNAAEGEPGSFKDRAIIRTNPYRVLEGALIAALAIGADEVVVATKEQFRPEVARLQAAAAEIDAAGWAPGIAIDVVQGPSAYLFGEETALLEVIDGRQPFPRIAPPWRRGIDDLAAPTAQGTAAAGDALGSDNQLAGPDRTEATPPALVDNVETMANVALILAHGADWFREVGTEASPGTIVCTVSGRMVHHGVQEYAMGTPLREVLTDIGVKPVQGTITAVLSGVSNAMVPARLLDTPLTYEAMQEVGSGLGTGGFIVFDETIDPVSVAHGVSRFLSVESCGQCTPCKQDGKAITEALDRVRVGRPDGDEPAVLIGRLRTVDTGARCFLATQHQVVVQSILQLFPGALDGHRLDGDHPVRSYPVAELVDIEGGVFVLDEGQLTKQPDWTHAAQDSGRSPAEWLDQRSGEGGSAAVR